MNKKTRKIFGVLFALVLIVALTISVSAMIYPKPPQPIKLDIFYCVPNESNTELSIVGVDGSEGKYLVIPEVLSEMKVTTIEENAFLDCKSEIFIVNPMLTTVGTNGFDSRTSDFIIFLVSRESYDGMQLDENWNGGGKVIFGNVYPKINDRLSSGLYDNLDFNDLDFDNLFLDIHGNGTNVTPASLSSFDKYTGSKSSSNLSNSNKDNSADKDNKPKPPSGDTVPEGDRVIPDHTIDGEDKPPAKRTLNKISIKTPPKKVAYIEGQPFEPNGIVISGEYSDGSKEIITGVSFPSETLVVGQTLVQITYEENERTYQAAQSISVTRKLPVSLNVAVPPEELTYIEGETFNRNGLKAVASYNNGSSKNVIPQVTTAPLSVGQGAVVLRYTENGRQVRAEQKITVLKKIPVSLSITTPPRKTSYIEEDMFDDSGMVITATYNDGSKRTVTAYTYEAKQLLKYQQFVRISYEENGEKVTVDCPIVTIPKIPVKLTVKTPPTKTTYVEQETFSPSGLVTTVTYNNGKSATVTAVSPTEPLVLGQTKVVVSYKEAEETVSCDIPITVLPAVPNSIKITKNPNQITYDAGRLFKPAGMIVKGVYSDGSEREVTGYTFPNALLTQGQSHVVISYTYRGVTRTANCSVTVGPQKYVYEKYVATGTNPYIKYTRGAWHWSDRASCGGRPATGHSPHSKSASGSIPNKKVYADFTYSNGKYTTTGPSYTLGTVVLAPRKYAKHVSSPGVTADYFFFTEDMNSSSLEGFMVDASTYCEPGGGGSTSYYNALAGISNITSEYRNYTKGSYVGEVTAVDGSLPNDGVSGSYWYVKKTAITDTIPTSLTAKKAVIEAPQVSIFEKWTTLNNHKQTYLADVEATKNALPQNGLHSDGYWYVFKKTID